MITLNSSYFSLQDNHSSFITGCLHRSSRFISSSFIIYINKLFVVETNSIAQFLVVAPHTASKTDVPKRSAAVTEKLCRAPVPFVSLSFSDKCRPLRYSVNCVTCVSIASTKSSESSLLASAWCIASDTHSSRP